MKAELHSALLRLASSACHGQQRAIAKKMRMHDSEVNHMVWLQERRARIAQRVEHVFFHRVHATISNRTKDPGTSERCGYSGVGI